MSSLVKRGNVALSRRSFLVQAAKLAAGLAVAAKVGAEVVTEAVAAIRLNVTMVRERGVWNFATSYIDPTTGEQRVHINEHPLGPEWTRDPLDCVNQEKGV